MNNLPNNSTSHLVEVNANTIGNICDLINEQQQCVGGCGHLYLAQPHA